MECDVVRLGSCGVSVKLDADVCQMMLRRFVVAFEDRENEGGEVTGVALENAVIVDGPFVVHGSEDLFVTAIDATAVPVQHVLDLNSVQYLLDPVCSHGLTLLVCSTSYLRLIAAFLEMLHQIPAVAHGARHVARRHRIANQMDRGGAS